MTYIACVEDRSVPNLCTLESVIMITQFSQKRWCVTIIKRWPYSRLKSIMNNGGQWANDNWWLSRSNNCWSLKHFRFCNEILSTFKLWIINGPVGPFSVAGVLASFDILGGRGRGGKWKGKGFWPFTKEGKMGKLTFLTNRGQEMCAFLGIF